MKREFVARSQGFTYSVCLWEEPLDLSEGRSYSFTFSSIAFRGIVAHWPGRSKMACDVRVIPIREFMKTDLTGEIDLSASRALLSDLMAACKRENMTRILIDSREATSHSTMLDVWTLAKDLGSLGVTHENRVAVLNRPKDNFDRAAFLELCATNRGYQLKAFREFEVAFSWLTSEQSSDDDAEDG